MPVVLGGTGDVGGGFAHLGDIYARAAQHLGPAIVNLNPDRGAGGGGGYGGQVTDAQVFQQQAQQAAGVQHAQLQNWLMQQDMTAHEQMRLQQQQNAVAQLQGLGPVDQGGNGTLNAQEVTEQVARIKTGIDLGQMRQRATQERLQQAHLKQLQAANAAQESMEQVHQSSRAAGFGGTVAVDFDNGGEAAARDSLSRYYENGEQPTRAELLQEADQLNRTTRFVQHRQTGAWEPQPTPRQTGGAHASLPPGALTEHEWEAAVQKVEDRVNKADEHLTPEQRAERNQARRDEINATVSGRLAHPDDLKKPTDVPTYRSYLEMRDPARRIQRERTEREVGAVNDVARDTRQAISNLATDDVHKRQLHGLLGRLTDATLEYRGREMPAVVRRRVAEWGATLNDAMQMLSPVPQGQPPAAAPPPTLQRPIIRQVAPNVREFNYGAAGPGGGLNRVF